MQGEIFTQSVHFLTFIGHLLDFAKLLDSELENFLSSNYSEFAVDSTGIVGFLKYVQIGFFFEIKKNVFFSKSGKSGKFAVDCV